MFTWPHLSEGGGLRRVLALIFGLLAVSSGSAPAQGQPWVRFEGDAGPGQGKHIVFVTGDEEYRSEEGMVQLARILAVRHGFACRVLFAVNAKTGEIDPQTLDNIPGLEALDDADLLVLFTRFRDLPDAQMKHIVDYLDSGRPIIGLRTATHAFAFKKHTTYRRFDWRSKEWPGGFGRQVLGETWIAHHGAHGRQSTRGIPVEAMHAHPILRGLEAGDVWDPTDVYRVRLPMAEGIQPLLLGQVLAGMRPDDEPAKRAKNRKTGKVVDKNDPMMPVAWIKSWTAKNGQTARVFATTLGSSQAFAREGTRRLLVNACYWALGLEDAISADANVALVGEYHPSPFGFGHQRRGVRPRDLPGQAAKHAQKGKRPATPVTRRSPTARARGSLLRSWPATSPCGHRPPLCYENGLPPTLAPLCASPFVRAAGTGSTP